MPFDQAAGAQVDDRPDERGYISAPPPPGTARPVLPLAYATPLQVVEPLYSHWPIFAAWAAALIAFFVMLWEVESVIVSGPILAAAGSVMLGVGIWKRRPSLTITGGSLCAVCVLFVTCVLTFGWGPRRADLPFGAMGAAYMIGLSAYSMLLIMRRRQRRGSAMYGSPPQ
jgi:hypothetical protein